MSNLVKSYPDFWIVDENTQVRTPSRFNSSQLIDLYKEHLGDRLRFNLLKLELEIDGKQVNDLEESLRYMHVAT